MGSSGPKRKSPPKGRRKATRRSWWDTLLAQVPLLRLPRLGYLTIGLAVFSIGVLIVLLLHNEPELSPGKRAVLTTSPPAEAGQPEPAAKPDAELKPEQKAAPAPKAEPN